MKLKSFIMKENIFNQLCNTKTVKVEKSNSQDNIAL